MATQNQPMYPARDSQAISYQVSIAGRGVKKLKHAALSELVMRRLYGEPIPEGVEVRIHVWRAGRELDWEDGNHRAENLRATLRRLVLRNRLTFSLRETR